MRYVDENFNDINEKDIDLTKGHLEDCQVIKKDATPIDDCFKFAWYDEDYEDAKMYCINQPIEPTQLDRVEAQALFTALMTDTLIEG